MNRIIRIARKIVADTTLSQYRENKEKLEKLREQKENLVKGLDRAMKSVEQFKKDIESGVFKVDGIDQKEIDKNKKLLLKMCARPQSYCFDISFIDKHKDYARAKEIYDAFFNLHFYSKDPEKLQRKIDEYTKRLQFMKEDVEGAVKLRDHLPLEFEKALQNVYDTILSDCEAQKEYEIERAENRLRNTWDIMVNPNNKEYENWRYKLNGMQYHFLKEVDFSKYKSLAAAIDACEDYVKPYEVKASSLNGNVEGLDKYSEELKEKIIGIESNYHGNASQLIKDIERSKNISINNLKDWYERWRKHFNDILEKKKNVNPEVKAKSFFVDMKNRFVDDLSRYCSEIVSVENAQVGIKGNIDAIVVAPNGRFKVKAVPAGGWNIQKYHYRVLINKLSD